MRLQFLPLDGKVIAIIRRNFQLLYGKAGRVSRSLRRYLDRLRWYDAPPNLPRRHCLVLPSSVSWDSAPNAHVKRVCTRNSLRSFSMPR
jgi:hypothetical protein